MVQIEPTVLRESFGFGQYWLLFIYIAQKLYVQIVPAVGDDVADAKEDQVANGHAELLQSFPAGAFFQRFSRFQVPTRCCPGRFPVGTLALCQEHLSLAHEYYPDTDQGSGTFIFHGEKYTIGVFQGEIVVGNQLDDS